MIRFAFLASALFLAATGAFAQGQPQSGSPAAGTAPTTVVAPTVPVASLATVQRALAKPGVVLLDVRTPEEYAAGHLSNAQNVNFRAADFTTQVSQLDPTKTYVLYCASGNRSGKATVLFQEKGFKNVINAGAFKTLQEGGVK
ncbi:rhodanese-like domain-containing protein [Hymenobacter taeanensis]|uniref:Rhodanese-like domain-containing protein n=1 Tax=Hymenobacter taeanensis TaxID=2735321 RepID=A0A6M6BN41_9BACT|nr:MULTISPECIES: rhodanese-like domain-containing protein [Hymenobacter]QJX48495.1 rhodanese-like domain-containing protein [Hymenobacter taeanensis]UOQ82008.1 rhodanese-like domain-containing protein [Hymenobacter sp. 5414T-23]